MGKIQIIVKRIIDIFFSIVGILVFFVPGIIIAILIKLDSKGPVFFLQKRTGKERKIFNILKFRTMEVNTPSMSGLELKENNSYITRIGHLLRKYSLDEIPQLINILLGHMSIVGPRPDREKPTQPYTTEEMIRFKVKPGLSGLAQINGRNELDFTERRKYDREYYERYSLRLDFFIIYKTVKVVLLKEGIYKDEEKKLEKTDGY